MTSKTHPFTKIYCLVQLLFLCSVNVVIGQTTLYSETFTGQNNKGASGSASGIIIDTSGVSWSVDTSAVNLQDANDYIQVVSERIEFRDTEGKAKWSSPAIDIAGFDSLTLSIDLLEVGAMESSDSIMLYYKIDNGPELELKVIADDFVSYILTDTALSGTGSELFVIVYAVNGADTEKHRIDNVTVKGSPTTSVEAITLDSMGTAVSLTFDATVVGANNGPFNGSGISSTPSNGQLNSHGIAIRGFSDGSVDFDSTNTTGDFGRGISSGGVGTGGVYAFEVSSGDFAIGHQSTAGDFTPGSFDFRLKNNTGKTAKKLVITYDVYEYNDQSMATSCNLYTSTNDTTYNLVNGVAITSTEVAAGSPSWVKSKVSKTVTGLTWAADEFYYVRFSFDDASGSGSRDEIALDNISFIAKDSTTTRTINGTLSGSYAAVIMDIESDEISATESITVTNNLNLTNGFLNVNNNSLELGTSSNDIALSGGSSSSFIHSGTIKCFVNNATNTYNFPIGSDATEYSPVNIDFTSSTLASGAYLEVSVDSAKHPNFSGYVSSYIDRNWTIASSDISSANYNLELDYASDDVVGTEASILPVKYSGGAWTAPYEIANNNVDTSGRGAIDTAQNKLTWTGLTSFSIFGGAGNGRPLPVVLNSFTGQLLARKKVLLNWSTAAEINCDYFILERITEKGEVEQIAQYTGAGTSNQSAFYQHVDKEARPGSNYYRLKQVDFDGKEEVFPVISVPVNEYDLSDNLPNIKIQRQNQSLVIEGKSVKSYDIDILSLSGQNVAYELIRASKDKVVLKPNMPNRGIFIVRLRGSNSNHKQMKISW